MFHNTVRFLLFVNMLTTTTRRNPRGASCVCATRDLLIFYETPLCAEKHLSTLYVLLA